MDAKPLGWPHPGKGRASPSRCVSLGPEASHTHWYASDPEGVHNRGAANRGYVVGTTLQLWVVTLIAFSFGALCARLLPYAANLLSSRRARRGYVEFIQPTYLRKPLPPLSDTHAKDIGLFIYRALRQQEDDCEQESLRQLPRLGKRAPRCYEMTARVLALLDALSSCAWGCAKGNHMLERLVGRSVNHARAATKLALMGFYDEALVLTRGVGEIANLLSLFAARGASFARWASLDNRTRRREFSPASVRRELEKIGTPIRVTTVAYAELSSRNVHVGPQTTTQTYNILGMPVAGAYYQEAGLIVCQNELAKALTFVIYAVANLTHLDKPLQLRLLQAGRDLIFDTGSLGIENMEEMWAALRKSASDSCP
jgi:hypothetical protein